MTENGHVVQRERVRQVPVVFPVPLDGTDAQASLTLDQRQKGLLWFSTYASELHARYTFTNPTPTARRVAIEFPLAQSNTIYDGFQVTDERGKPVAVTYSGAGASWTADFEAGASRSFSVGYRSRGMDSWRYQLIGGTGEVRNFKLTLDTSFPEVDFPAGTLSPTRQQTVDGRWQGTWEFKTLVANAAIGMALPQRLNPGDVATRITFFAPVGLLFFFFVVAVRAAGKKLDLHPLNYFFLGCAFFAFHLLFAYLVDHVAILPSLAIASAVSIFLVASYARLFLPLRFVLADVAIAQLLYLVLFSVTFLWKGYTGLSITVGAVLTLFVMMQFTGRRAIE